MKSNHSKHITTSTISIVGFFTLLFLFAIVPTPEYFISDPDGGHQLSGAMQILSGGHPFIDFRSSYGPLTFYASAFGQIISGNRIIGEILLIVSGYFVAYILLFKLFFDASKKLSVSLICLCFALILMPRFYKYYLVLGPALTLYSSWKYIDDKSMQRLVLLAFSIALTGLYRFDFGVYSGICGVVTVYLVTIRERMGGFRSSLLGFSISIICFFSPWILWALYKGGMGNYINDTLSGIIHQSIGLSISFPWFQYGKSIVSLNNMTFYVFAFHFLIPTVSLTVLISQRDKMAQTEKHKIFVAILLSQLTLIQATHRSDVGHLLQSSIINYILIAWLLSNLVFSYAKCMLKCRIFMAICVFLCLCTVLSNIYISGNLSILHNIKKRIKLPNSLSLLGDRNEVLDQVKTENPENEYLKVIEYININSYKDDPVLAIPFLASIYYFSERTFGGGQMLLAPGYFSTDQDQKEMIRRLNINKVKIIVEESNAAYDGLDSRKIANFANTINNYINDNYVEVKRIGRFVIKIHI